jgi:glycosyltransferase involved in cell wall biosynthesis
MTALKVLCLDGEGGYGGSSRSLSNVLAHVPRSEVEVEVWCRRTGPVQAVYAAMGVPVRVMPDLPAAGSVERLSRNIASELLVRLQFLRAGAFKRELVQAASSVDVVHLNLESLWRVALFLKRATRVGVTMHVRTNPVPNAFARRQARLAARHVDRFVFITENERAHFEALAGQKVTGEVIFNSVEPSAKGCAPRADMAADTRFKVSYLANFDWSRGPDRVLDVAEVLAKRGRTDIAIYVAGDMRLKGHLEGEFAKAAATGETLEAIAKRRGLAGIVYFLGHVTDPEAVLVASDALLKPTRLANPWGRDILEAMSFGLPVLSVGRYNRLVQTDATGVLFEQYAPETFAEAIMKLADNRDEARRLGAEGAHRVGELCSGSARARDLMDFWRKAAGQRA